jgi:hypothetical protein
MRDDREIASARRVHEAQKLFRPFSDYERDECWVHPATLQAMREAEAAFDREDYDLTDHLAAVVTSMMRRDLPKFQADPAAWKARLSGDLS